MLQRDPRVDHVDRAVLELAEVCDKIARVLDARAFLIVLACELDHLRRDVDAVDLVEVFGQRLVSRPIPHPKSSAERRATGFPQAAACSMTTPTS